ncbi:MAG: hypothetical protein H7Y15_13465 [Pseudonocardia sp.]|nr:hypothetical protein [Pseudonocardia sp.]
MARTPQNREMEQAATTVADLLADAVQATISHGTPSAAREAVEELESVDARTAPEHRGGPAQLLGMLTLVRWLGLVREETPDRAERVEESLNRVAELLGPRYRSRARYVAGPLQSVETADDVEQGQAALQGEFLPALVWLVAGAVAEFGAGDVDWLRKLENGTTVADMFG